MADYKHKWNQLKAWLEWETNRDSNVEAVLEIMTKLKKERDDQCCMCKLVPNSMDCRKHSVDPITI